MDIELEPTEEAAIVKGPETTVDPGDSGCPGGCTTYPFWCEPPIKGNISQETGEWIYHVPGGEWYDKTNIHTEYGERWFCTEAEAQAAGWRRSYE
jgi:hypothetical protein